MMSIAIWCVFVAFLMPYILVMSAKSGGYDNHNPRPGLANLSGWRARAYSAQLNCFEAFAPFAAGVLFAQSVGVAQLMIDQLALTFVVARILYSLSYLTDKPAIRSLVWVIGWGATIALFIFAATH